MTRAIKLDDVIRLRNEGMAYALKIAKDRGIEELQKQVQKEIYGEQEYGQKI